MKTLLIPKEEMLRANPHMCGTGVKDNYTASVETAQDAIALANKLKISYFDLDGVFYGRTNRGWNQVR